MYVCLCPIADLSLSVMHRLCMDCLLAWFQEEGACLESGASAGEGMQLCARQTAWLQGEDAVSL